MRGFRSKSRRSSFLLILTLMLPVLLSACTWGGNHSPLNPASEPSNLINRLWWIMFWMAVGIEALVAGLVVIFDSADGGMIAATVGTLQQWKAGTLSDAAFWHKCFFDPPETLDGGGNSASQ